MSVDVRATAARLGGGALGDRNGGGLVVTGGPGELFANLTNTVKERSGGAVTMPLAQVNDGLGYIMQEVEYGIEGGQGAGFFAGGVVNYEDSYALDRCFGDRTLDGILELLGNP